MLKRKKLVSIVLVCTVIAILAIPGVISILNNGRVAQTSEGETDLGVVSLGSIESSGVTEVVSTESTEPSSDSSLAVDSDGNVHIAWQDETDYGGSGWLDTDIFYKRYEVGVGWTTTEVVSTGMSEGSGAPSLAVDSHGNVHIAWEDWTDYAGSGTDADIFYKRYEVGSGWTTTEVVSTESTGGSDDPCLAVDASGNVHIAWGDGTDYVGCGSDWDIFYKRYEVGSGWTTTEVISTESTGSSDIPCLAVDSNGYVHIAWEDLTDYAGCGTDQDIFYKRYEVGVGWTITEVVSTESTIESEKPSLAVDSSGNVHVAWNSWELGFEPEIFYKRYEVGVGWTTTEVVSTIAADEESIWPSLAVDASGNVHIAWEDDTDYAGAGLDSDILDRDIFYRRFMPGIGWSTTEVVSTESGNASWSCSLAVDASGSVHIAWQDSTNYAGCGTDLDIFYKHFDFAVPSEPSSLRDIVEFPGAAHLRDLEAEYSSDWESLTTTVLVSTESTLDSLRPSSAVDSSGNLHVAWWDHTDYGGSGTDWDIFYKRYEVGVGWTITEVVSTESTGASRDPSLAVDSSGNVHIAWYDYTDYDGSGTDADIFYKRYVVGVGWSTTEVVSTESTSDSHEPSLAVDSSGNAHIAWHDWTDYGGSGTDIDIFYKRYEVGVGWIAAEVVSTESTGASRDPSLAVDSSGNVHVAWEDDTDYAGSGTDYDSFYKRYVVGVGWSTTEVVSTESTGNSLYPSLAVDSSGNVHIAWYDYTDYGGSGTDADIFYRSHVVGVGWSTTEVVSTESTSDSEKPSLAVDSSGNAHIAWHDWTDYGGSGTDRDIFYKYYVVNVGWSTTEVVSTESTGSSYDPCLAVDFSGNVHLAWRDYTDYAGSGTDADIFYKSYGFEKCLELVKMMSTVEGLPEMKNHLESKGFLFEPVASNVSLVDGGLNHIAFSGSILSWWSDVSSEGTRALLVAAMMDDGRSLVFGVITNLLPAEMVPEVDPYVIVNAMPYTYVQLFYYDTLDGRIVDWSYWWYDSDIHSDWFWEVYWKWRNYIDEYYGWHSYLPWWWWLWHYTYDKHWHNWLFEVGASSSVTSLGGSSSVTEVVSTESTGASYDPSLAVDASGNLYVAWHDYTDYGGSGIDADIFCRSHWVGVGWTTLEVVSWMGNGHSLRPSLAVDSDGNIHVAWDDDMDYAGTDADIYYKRYEVGEGWIDTELVSTESTGSSYAPSLAVDFNGNVHVAWHDNTDYTGSGTDVDIFYKRYEVGVGWTTTEVVSTESTGGSRYACLAVDAGGNVHIAWHDHTDYTGSGTDYDIFYKRYELGVGWTATEVVSTESTSHSYYASLTVDSSGNVHVAWYDYTDYAGCGTDTDIFCKRYELGVGWTATEVVSTESTGSSYYACLAVDSSGNVNIAWEDLTDYAGSGTDRDIFYKHYVVSVGWSTTEVVSTESTGSSYDACLAVDATGDVHIAWEDLTDYAGSGTDLDIFYKHFDFAVPSEPSSLRDIVEFPGAAHLRDLSETTYPLNTWEILTTKEVVSTESTELSRSPSLAVDSGGNVHVAWHDFTDYAGSGTDYDIFYKRYEVGYGWTATEVVSTESTFSSYEPSLAVDSDGNVHIAWRDYTNYAGAGTDLDIFYKRLVVGVGWTTTEVVSTESTSDSNDPSLAVDSSGNVHIAWRDYTDYGGSGTDADVFYKRYVAGVGWSAAEVVSTESTGTSFAPSLAVDSDGNVHIAWHDSTDYAGSGTDYDIFYKRYEVGYGWSAAEVVSTESTEHSQHPCLAVDSDRNIHVAWYDRTDYGGVGTDADIFYKRYVVGVGWTTTVVVSTESTDASLDLSLAVDSSGNVHVAWQDSTDYAGSGSDWDIFYRHYIVDSGWTVAQVVSTESTGDSQEPCLAVDSSGNIHVVWRDDTDYAAAGNDDDIFYRWAGPDKYWTLIDMISNTEGSLEMKNQLESKGFVFKLTASSVSAVGGGLNYTPFSGFVLSWWSDVSSEGTRALLVAAMMDDGRSLVFGVITNLLPPELIAEIDPYIIVNAMPYTYVQWFFYDTLNDRIVTWSHWWYDSDVHPDWFWEVYWKWRNYMDEYSGWHGYLPWWWWLWHYTYDKHWHNWST